MENSQTPPKVAIVSVQGRPGLNPVALADLEAVAEVDIIARGDLPAMTHAEAVELLGDADIVGLTPKVTPTMDEGLLSQLPRLRAVGLHATGTDMYDLAAFRRHGVQLATLPDYSTTSVAEHAMAMLLSLSRRVHLGHDRSRGLVPPQTSLRGFELSGKTMGIIGFGRIGQRVGGLATAFGVNVIACDPRADKEPDTTYLPLEELLASSDIVVVACSRHHDDPPLLAVAELDLLPLGASLVVISRAAAVDTDAAADAIRSGRLRGYAVDDAVVDTGRDGDLLTEGRIVQTGHAAWWSDEVLTRGAIHWVESLRALAVGAPVSLDADAAPEKAYGVRGQPPYGVHAEASDGVRRVA